MIPIAQPSVGEEEINAARKILKSKFLAQGEEVKKFEKNFSSYIGTKFGIATSNGTTALHAALIALEIKEGDEVITTPFSFFSSSSCILMQKAKPIFVDIDPKTYNIDPEKIKEKISKRTKAIIPVHLYGQPCEIEKVMEIAKEYSLWVIEDACQAHGAEFNGKKVGSFSDISCFSFYPTKNMTTGEGGMITTDDENLAEKLRMIINHGQKERYLHEMLGYNYRMTNLQAAIGLVQLKRLDKFNEKRIGNASFYNENLDNGIIEKPFVSKKVKHVFNQYTLRIKDGKRDKFAEYLKKKGIGYGIYYPIPIHKQPLFKEKYGDLHHLPEAELSAKEVISIPVHPRLSEEDLEYITKVVNNF
jgi:dTDP-4-amino-4,6-dideoxygalactose transaminase